MRLSDFFREVGRPISYYARLNNITGSATATLFISQFLYWEGKQRDPDGWIYKTQVEIQEETGLNRTEQENARKQLKKLGLLEERRVGIPARLEYLPVLDEIDRQWCLFLESGGSIALAEKQQNAEKKIQNIGATKQSENGSNPHGCQIVQVGQTRSSYLDKQDGPTRTDILYTETTNRDYSQRLHKQSIKQSDNGVSEKTPDSRDSFIQEEIRQQQHGKADSYSTVEHQSGYLNAGDGENSEIDPSGGFSLKKEKRERKRRIAYTYDDWGYIVLPVKGHTKLAAALALRTMQFRLAEEIGCEFYVEDGEVWVNDGKASYELTEQAAFGKSDEDNEDEDRAHLPMGKLRGISGISPESYNMQVMEWFKEWMGWCKQYGKRTASILSKYSVIQIMDVVDYDDYDEESA